MNEQRRATPGVVTCQACGAYIGHYVERWNAAVGRWETWLAVGGAVLESAHGVCAACGAEWHWSASSKRLERLIGLVRREDTTQPDDPCEGCEQRWYGECERCELNPKRNKERGDEGADASKMLERLQEIGKNLDPEAVKRILGDSGGSSMSDDVKFVFRNQRRLASKKAEIELFLIHVLAVRGDKMTFLGSLYLSAEEWQVMKNAASSAVAFEIEE